MRNYLYIWHDAATRVICASGLETKDLVGALGDQGGLLLLEHQWDDGYFDLASGFSFVPLTERDRLCTQDISSWGDFTWADYQTSSSPLFPPPVLPAEELAELLYFRHKQVPLRGNRIPTLSNRFLASVHDDGWRLALYYSNWHDVEKLLTGCVGIAEAGPLDYDALREGKSAFWLHRGRTEAMPATTDIDSILSKGLRSK